MEAWTSGATWEQAMADSNLDDGDIARLLSRVADVLRQITWCDALLPELRNNARRARKAIDRPPISDPLN